jgi:hypothetical protein
MPVALVNTWTGVAFPSALSSFQYPSPATDNQSITIGNSDGNWLVAFAGWTSMNLANPVTMSIGDDAHNLWLPLGTALTSALCSVTIWVAPAARAAGAVYAAPSSEVTATGLVVQEFSGMGNGLAIGGFVTSTTTSPSGSAVTLPAQAQSSLILTAGIYDNNSYGNPIGLTGAGWAGGNTLVHSLGAGYGFDLIMGTALQVTSGSTSATWHTAGAGSGGLDVTAVIAAVSAVAAPPAQPTPNWPAVQLQAAFGSTTGGPAGQATPPDQRIWTDLSGRLLSWDESRGGQYELDKLEAAEVNVLLDNHDGVLTPRPPWAITATTGSGNATTITVSTADAAKVTAGDFFQLYVTAPPAGAVKQAAVFQVTAVNTTTGLVTFTPAAAANPASGNVAQSGTLTPLQTGQVTSFTPVRLLTTWGGRTSVSFGGFTERWPQEWSQTSWWQQSHAVFTDVWSLINAQMLDVGQAEILADGPYAYWPCNDAAGSTAAANLAPANSQPLIVKQCKAGPGNASYTFGASSGEILVNASTWSQTGVAQPWSGAFIATATSAGAYFIASTNALPGNIAVGNHMQLYNSSAQLKEPTTFVVTQLQTGATNFILFSPNAASNPQAGDEADSSGDNNYGYCLFYQPPVAQPITAAGITINAWFNVTAGQNSFQTLWSLKQSGGPIALLSLAGAGNPNPGQMAIALYDKVTGGVTAGGVISTGPWNTGTWFNVTTYLTPTAWTVIINGGANPGATGTCNITSAWEWISFGGQSDAYTSGFCINGAAGTIAHCAIFSYIVPYQRVATQYLAAANAFGNSTGSNLSFDSVDDRIERYLNAAGYTGPRCIDPCDTSYGQGWTTAATETSGKQANTAVEDMAASDGGVLFIAGDGSLFYRANQFAYNFPPGFVLGELTGSGEIPYLDDARVGYDPSLVVNAVSLSQQNGTSVSPNTVLAPYIAASQARYGSITSTPSVFLYDLDAVGDLANWIAELHGAAQLRVEQVTVDAAKTTAAWPLVLWGDVGDIVLFHRRPISGGAPALSISTQVLKLHRTLEWSTGTAKLQLTLSPYYGNALATNSATFGFPNGSVILARG